MLIVTFTIARRKESFSGPSKPVNHATEVVAKQRVIILKTECFGASANINK